MKVVRRLHQTPGLSERNLIKKGISLSEINFCLQALVGKGWINGQSFSRSMGRLRYTNFLTLTGVDKKSNLPTEFLKRMFKEYVPLKKRTEWLTSEIPGFIIERKS